MAAKKKKNYKKKKTGSNKPPVMTQQAAAEDKTTEEIVQKDQKEVVKTEKKSADKKAKGSNVAKNAVKKKDKNKKPNVFTRLVTFIKEVIVELKKVSWLSNDELMKSTSVVAGIVLIFTLMTWIVDSGFGAIAAALIGSK